MSSMTDWDTCPVTNEPCEQEECTQARCELQPAPVELAIAAVKAVQQLHSAVDSEMGDSDLDEDDSPLMRAMQAAAPFAGDDGDRAIEALTEREPRKRFYIPEGANRKHANGRVLVRDTDDPDWWVETNSMWADELCRMLNGAP